MNTFVALIVSLLCVAIGFALFWFVAVPQDHGFFSVGDSATNRLFVGFFATLLGVLLGSTYRQLARMKEANVQTIPSIRRFAQGVIRSVDLWMGLVASPLVYGLLVQSAANMTFAGLVIVALENGFCCLLIAENIVKRTPANAVANPSGG